MLENIARSAAGALVLAKLNVDAVPSIASQLGIRAMPTVMGLVGGKLVDRFEGLPPTDQLRAFFEKLLAAAQQMGVGGAGPVQQIAQAITAASTMVDEGRPKEAMRILPQVLGELHTLYSQVEESLVAAEAQKAASAAPGGKGTASTPAPIRRDTGPLADVDVLIARAMAAMVRALLAVAQEAAADEASKSTGGGAAGTSTGSGPGEGVRALYDQVNEYAALLRSPRFKAWAKDTDVARALSAADLAKTSGTASTTLAPLLEAVAAHPDDPDKLFALAEAQVGVGHAQEAVDALLTIIRKHGPGWREGAAKSTLLKVFDTLGAGNEVAVAGRKQLSKLLFR